MKYSVIYEVDVPRGVNMRPFVPLECKKLWDETEGDEQYAYAYLEGEWAHGHHRKWCAILSEEQFREFVDHVGLFADPTETMGSIGAPGYGFGWAPAIAFRNDDPDALQSAYVTPSGTKAELIEFFEKHEKPAPSALTDDPNQMHLFPEDAAMVNPWKLLRALVLAEFGA